MTILQPRAGLLLGLGAACFGAGVLVYLVARPLGMPGTGPLPTLTHTAAFCLFSAAVVARPFAVCATWAAAAIALEAAQAAPFETWFASIAWFGPYCVRGVFDPLDVAAAVAGAAFAHRIIYRSLPCNDSFAFSSAS